MNHPIYSYQKARQMYNVTNGAGFPAGSENLTKAFLRQPIYDTLPVSAAPGLQTLSFFTTLGDAFKTNMSLAGQFPNGQDFLCWNIQPYFTPAEEPQVYESAVGLPSTVAHSNYANDVAAFYENAILTVNILSTKWLQAPVQMMPPANRLAGSAAIGVGVEAASTESYVAETNLASWGGEVFDVNGFWIPANTNIEIVVSLNLAAGLPSDENGTLRLVMDGVLYRNTQ